MTKSLDKLVDGNLQKSVEDGVDTLKKKTGEAVDDLQGKAKEIIEKAKAKLTPETLAQIKDVAKQVKEVLGNLPIQIPGGLEKLIEKLDRLIDKLDPLDDSREAAELDARVLAEVRDAHLMPYVDAAVAVAKQDVEQYARRLVIVADLLLLLEREVDRLPAVEAPPEGEVFAGPGKKPCPNPKPANEVQIDHVPPSRKHWPCAGDHWHCLEHHQAPWPDCRIFKKRTFGGCIPPAAPATC